MDTGLTVACVLWVGEFRGRSYSPDWVRRLRSMCARHLPEHRFVCLSNVEVQGIETIDLSRSKALPGWWSKLELFRPDNGLSGRVIYLDLDTLIVDDLTPVAEWPLSEGELGAAPPSYFWCGSSGRAAGGPGIVDRVQSTVMTWRAGEVTDPWRLFTADAQQRYRGDQDWIGAVQDAVSPLPGSWFCKLRDCTDGPPMGGRVVASMPWKNAEAARKFRWVRETWC